MLYILNVLLFLCLIIGLPKTVCGMTWERQLELARKVSRQGNTTTERIQRGQDSALVLGRIALKIAINQYGSEDLSVGTINNRLGDFAYRKGDVISASNYWLEALRISDHHGEKGIEVRGGSLSRLGIYAKKSGINKSNSMSTDRALSFVRRTEASYLPEFTRRLFELAYFYENLDYLDDFYRILQRIIDIGLDAPDSDPRYAIRSFIYFAEKLSKPPVGNVGTAVQFQDSAIVLGLRALKMAEEYFGPNDTLVAYVANRLGDYYDRRGYYDKLEPLWERAWRINRAVFPPEHIEVQGGILRMAGIYKANGRYALSEAMYRQAVELRAKTQGPEHPETAGMNMQLGRLLHITGKYDESEIYYRKALFIREQAVERVDSDIAQSFRFLGLLFYDRGEYVRAEEYLSRALAIREDALGPEHALTASCMDDLGNLYLTWGRPYQAEQVIQNAVTVREKYLGRNHPDLARSLEHLASVYISTGRYEDARVILKRALQIRKPLVSKGKYQYASLLSTMARILDAEGDRKGAIRLADSALALNEAAIGSSDHRLSYNMAQVARLYQKHGKYEKADSLYARMFKKNSEERKLQIPNSAQALENYADLCILTKRVDQATELYGAAFTIRLHSFENAAAIMSERNALKYERLLHTSRDKFLSCYFHRENANNSPPIRLTDALFASKGPVSTGLLIRNRQLRLHNVPSTQLILDSLRVVRAYMSKLYIDGPGETDYDVYLDKLRGAINNAELLETRLARLSSDETPEIRNLRANTSDISGALPKESILLEYVKYDDRDLIRDTSFAKYAVIGMTRNSSPFAFDLGPADAIDSAVSVYRKHLIELSKSGKPPDRSDLREYASISGRITDLIWTPIQSSLPDSGLIFIAPDGALNLVSFTGLLDQAGRYLAETYTLHYLTSGRDLLRGRELSDIGVGLAAFGDPDFDALPQSPPKTDETLFSANTASPLFAGIRNVRSTCEGFRSQTVSRLPGTRKEVNDIVSLWRKKRTEPAWRYVGAQASEDIFKRTVSGKRVVHLATHGFFALSDCSQSFDNHFQRINEFIVGENPLLLSGLYFAGANLHGAQADSLNVEDGILTAAEVSNLNLDGVQLVVLSACESGVGDIREGEGVYGLRRAFQMAGARTVISALWQVSDQATAEFMKTLYENLDGDIASVLRTTALARLADLRKREQPDHPYNWAAFIATGDWIAGD